MIRSKIKTLRAIKQICPDYIKVLMVYFLGGAKDVRIRDRFGNEASVSIDGSNVREFMRFTRILRNNYQKWKINKGLLEIDGYSIDLSEFERLIDIIKMSFNVVKHGGQIRPYDNYYLVLMDGLKWICRKYKLSDFYLGPLLPYEIEPLEYQWFKRILKCGDVFVDVGASVGGYTLRACKIGARVFAIEPQEDYYFILKKNIELNNFKAQLFKCACGQSAFSAPIYGHGDMASLVKNWLNEEISGYVNVVPLDDIIPHDDIKLLKIDVEGYEIEVLRGAKETLKRTEYIILEVTDKTINQCNKFLQDLNFKMLDIIIHTSRLHETRDILFKRW